MKVSIYTADIDLTALVGQDVKFILTVLATGSPVGDRALWVAPIIYNAAGSTIPPTATNTPTHHTDFFANANRNWNCHTNTHTNFFANADRNWNCHSYAHANSHSNHILIV